MGGKSSGTKAKPKFKSYAEARKDREKFRKKLVRAMERSVMLLVFCSVYNVKTFFHEGRGAGAGVIGIISQTRVLGVKRDQGMKRMKSVNDGQNVEWVHLLPPIILPILLSMLSLLTDGIYAYIYCYVVRALL